MSVVSRLITRYHNNEWGFTGTRTGMTDVQTLSVRRALRLGLPLVIRHGGAIGADTEFHALWRECCFTVKANDPREKSPTGPMAEVWPCEEERAKIFRGSPFVMVQRVMSPLQRNEEIAQRSKFLLATPRTDQPEQRSGTWHTIRCAARIKIPVLIFWPNGSPEILSP